MFYNLRHLPPLIDNKINQGELLKSSSRKKLIVQFNHLLSSSQLSVVISTLSATLF